MTLKTVLLAAAFAALATTATAQKKPVPAPAAAAPAKPAAPTAADWRTPKAEDVLVIDTNKGRIIVEMVPEVAPLWTAQMRALTLEHFYDGQTFFRVIEDFMDQTGDPENRGTGQSSRPNVNAEFQFRRGPETPFVLVADQAVAEVGFIKSLPVTTQSMMLAPMTRDGKISGYGLFCPGVGGAARGEDENSANSQFFLMRANYPRLERRYTAWGRVISGMDVVTAIKVGEPVPDPQDKMERVRLLSDIPEKDRPKIRVIDPAGQWFKAEIARAQALGGANFTACDVNIPVEVK
ncbi:MAG: peptidylprolyl isomerase [Alphaproteobacteria bacterium]|nr:peptidylprolyl isomerase [Alphaproteobacteria bacterium]MBU1516441.1 peptidylprolyl isomerase [Alphaproteobacteria bacterium]MBU2094198.1 peptidylprolyl isomerase [Alphaproteobacteria bacterium]MBU2150496.1 peptidylprolyl isomerase [Alphaproteobacteria bacterium]MBU2307368.1 peptidylprolyl isomerase [Alphaproteobacteria bacterium]